jgi:hypothetical protein
MITLTRGEAQNVLNLLIVWLDEQEEPDTETAIETLRAKLSEPEPEPVAWKMKGVPAFHQGKSRPTPAEMWEPLYTAPPQREWVGLTDEEIRQSYETTGHYQTLRPQDSFAVYALARAIEAKLKGKNYDKR